MRNHRLFAAGLAAALMLGVAAPAMAGPGKGKANAPGQTKTKPTKPEKQKPPKKAKKTKAGVSGGGVVNGAEFSIQARLRDVKDGKASKGHFNYTTAGEAFKIRCRGFNGFTPAAETKVTFNNCAVTGVATPVSIEVTVVDNGQPSATTADSISFTVADTEPDTVVTGPLTDGNIKVRFLP